LLRRPSPSSLFPYTTLFRSHVFIDYQFSAPTPSMNRPQSFYQTDRHGHASLSLESTLRFRRNPDSPLEQLDSQTYADPRTRSRQDRKSTRLNSSHRTISYAV